MSLHRSSLFPPPVRTLCAPTGHRTGRSGWTTLSRSWIRSSPLLLFSFLSLPYAHRRQVNRTPRRILSTFQRHFVNASRMSTASRNGSPGGFNGDSRRESGFDFISRMNMQLRDSHRRNYRAASATSLHQK